MTDIMIVEDEAIICKDIETSLNNLGYTVVTTTDKGEEAVGKADSYRPDIILMDINLKGKIDGIETAAIIRSRLEIPVIFLTAYMDKEKLDRAKLTMPFGYLLKPVQERDLRVALELAIYSAEMDAKRRKVEEELLQSKNRFQDIVLSSSDWIWELDQNGKYTFVSPKIEKVLGFHPDEIIGKTPFDLMSNEEAARVQKIFKKIFSQKKPIVSLENWNLTKQGERICFLTNGLPLLDKKGNLIGYRGADKDITAQKLAEEKLRFQASLFEQIDKAIITIDFNNTILSWNKFAEKLYQWSGEEAIGQDIVELLAPDEMKTTALLNIEHLNREGHWEGNYDVKKKDGTTVPAHIINTYLKNSSGEPIGFIGISNDITQQLQAENKLRSSESRFQDLYDNAPDMYASMDVKTAYIVECNQTLIDATGYAREEIIGRSVFDLYTPESAVYAKENILPTFLKTGIIKGDELCIRKKDGSIITVSLNVSAVRDSDGKITFSRASWRDISDRKKMEKDRFELEQQLFQAQKMESLGTLASGIAHDFNNLLFQILGYTQLAIKTRATDLELRSFLDPVEVASNKAAALVRQILSFSRGTISEFQPLAIQPIVKEVLKLLRASIPTTIEIRQNINENCGHILTDAIKIYQVIMNLCTNAYQAMLGQMGVLEVNLDEIKVKKENLLDYPSLNLGSYLELIIRDTGHGMERETQNKIFDPLFTTKSEKEGTGLGLSIVQKIIDEHRGIISVSSVPGEGSTFSIYLPRVDSPALSATKPELKPSASGVEKIMIVDDEHSIVALLQELLKQLGYQVSGFINSPEALNAFQNNPHDYQLVLLDQTMPEITGTELSERFLSIRRDIPIILMTGHSESVSEEQALNIGIKKFKYKPLDVDDLTSTIREILDN